ncbi:hypothetical protein [Enterococcus ureasiticus]|uniref:Uncharacterized protein n=1 Tax=Enterococcus ureasiticus TaxID=903984 RepID=A0A1E5G8V4_9ENTE|nr:hypothetical protein [Enterococcus ureasiticus]OEG09015.1 hypothetical protein BCR21_15685 [Enterococcus ureasiticus]
MNIVYKGNTFLKEDGEMIILRVGQKEYRFPKKSCSIDSCKKSIRYFQKPTNQERFIQAHSKEEIKAFYLLMKVQALAMLPKDIEITPINMYIIRNYTDYIEVIRRYSSTKYPVIQLVTSQGSIDTLKFIKGSCVITSVYQENSITILDQPKDLEQLQKELKRRKSRGRSNLKVERLLKKYAEILMIDRLSLHPKYEPSFMFTSDLQLINYDILDQQEVFHVIVDQIKEMKKDEQISQALDFLQRHPSFFLTYNVEKEMEGVYSGKAFLRGINQSEVTFSGIDYIDILEQILNEFLPLLQLTEEEPVVVKSH